MNNYCVSIFRSLDLGAPLVVGRLPPEFGYSDQLFQQEGFTGCIRDLTVNGKVLDFSRALVDRTAGKGCAFTDATCQPNPCENDGRCVGYWNSFYCDCAPEFSGPQCSEGKTKSTTPALLFRLPLILTLMLIIIVLRCNNSIFSWR